MKDQCGKKLVLNHAWIRTLLDWF